MKGMNKVILYGNIGKDPEYRTVPMGHGQGGSQTVCNFSLATSESYTDKSGQKQTKTEWHRCVAWRKLAEIMQQTLRIQKGNLVLLEGKLRTRSWDDQQTGQKKYITEIEVSDLWCKTDFQNDGMSGHQQGQHQQNQGGGQLNAGSPPAAEDDLPF